MQLSRVRNVVVIAVVLGLAGAGCKKDASQGAPAPTGTPAARPAVAPPVNPAQVQMPALFAHIPADSPYVLASLEAMPLDVVGKMADALRPTMASLVELGQAFGGDSAAGRVLGAALQEFDGKWNAAGLESLGFSARPRFAVYGLGLQPVVARVELKDDRAVLALVQRVAKAAQVTLPDLEVRSGAEFWRIPLDDDGGMIVSLGKNQLVVAVGERQAIAASMDVILGTQLPPQSMADGSELKALMAAHGFGPYLIGFGDSRRIADQAIAIAGAKVPPACRDQIDRLVGDIPRVAIGYGEVSTKRFTGGAVVELAPALAADLAAAQVAVPGLDAALAGTPVIAFGGGVDVAKGRALFARIGARLGELGQACGEEDMIESGQELVQVMGAPVPKALEAITGGAVRVDAIALDTSGRGFPVTQLDGYAMLTSGDPEGLFELLVAQEPNFARMGVTADGKLHPVDVKALGVPFGVWGGVGERALVLATGKQAPGDGALAATAGAPSPLLAMSLDYGRFLQLQSQFEQLMGTGDPLGMSAGMNQSLANLYGRTDLAVTSGARGLRLWGMMELK